MARAIKQPAETKIYEFDFSDQLGDQLEGVPVIVSDPTGLTISAPTVQGGMVRASIAGGTVGATYLVTASAVTPGALASAEIELEVVVIDLGATLPPGVTSPYLTGTEYVTRFGLSETVQLTDEDRTGAIDGAVLMTALADATDTVNGFARGLYAIPLNPVVGDIKRIVADLARERLHNDQATPQVTARADEARSLLKDIAKGVYRLPVELAAPPLPTTGSGISFRAPKPIFAGCGLP